MILFLPLSVQPHPQAQRMGRGPAAIASLHGLQCLMHVLLLGVCVGERWGPSVAPLVRRRRNTKPPGRGLWSCRVAAQGVRRWWLRAGWDLALSCRALQSAHAGSTQGTSHVHPVVRVRGRCQLTQHHADMSRSQASPQTPRLALGEAHRMPSKCGDKNLLLATHWPPWVWWLSWGQMELRIGYPQLRWLAMLSEPPHVH